MQLDVYNMSGDVVGSMDLSDEIFAIEPNEDAVYRVMIAFPPKRNGTCPPGLNPLAEPCGRRRGLRTCSAFLPRAPAEEAATPGVIVHAVV